MDSGAGENFLEAELNRLTCKELGMMHIAGIVIDVVVNLGRWRRWILIKEAVNKGNGVLELTTAVMAKDADHLDQEKFLKCASAQTIFLCRTLYSNVFSCILRP